MSISAAVLVEAYDQARRLHPIDRAVMLRSLIDGGDAAGPDEPLGQRNAGLLRLRAALVGPSLSSTTPCPGCDERLALDVETSALLASAGEPPSEVTVGGRRFAPVTSRHLAALAAAPPSDAALSLVAACALDSDSKHDPVDVSAVEAALDEADPLADIVFTLTCVSCGKEWDECLDVPTLVWTELGHLVAELLDGVHVLASAYGWSEQEVLGLPAQRRQAYIDRILS